MAEYLNLFTRVQVVHAGGEPGVRERRHRAAGHVAHGDSDLRVTRQREAHAQGVSERIRPERLQSCHGGRSGSAIHARER